MFGFLRKKRISNYTQWAQDYFEQVQNYEKLKAEGVRFSMRVAVDDNYNERTIKDILKNYSKSHSTIETINQLNRFVDKTFVDGVMNIIRVRGYKDSDVYKSAFIDRRLFSKIMSNREYQPSKDTAIALAFALKLTTEQANDLLSRAGYTLSHSSRRDIIIEYFFEEKIYSLVDINEVLYNLNEKIIGR